MASDGESEFIPLGSKRRRTGFYKTGQVGKTVSFNKKHGESRQNSVAFTSEKS